METQKIDWSGVKKLALKSVSTDVIVIRGTEEEKTIQYEGEAPKIEKRNETLLRFQRTSKKFQYHRYLEM